MRKKHSLLATAVVVVVVAGTGAGARSIPVEDTLVETQYFSFHSDPWINLHHFLYQWSRADGRLASGRQEVVVPERDGAGLDGRAETVWTEALDFYADNVAPRGHFDEEMLELKSALLELGGDSSADAPDVIPGIAGHLAAAMPVYLETWWTEHDRTNRAWVALVAGEVRRYEDDWVETATRVFGGRWQEGRLRVDASAYANWAGGYTSNGPAHTVIWSADETNNEWLYGLELVFHESGHMSSLAAPTRSLTREIFRDEGVPEPGNLRHSLIFATSGELVRGIAESRGLPEHVPYVVSEGLTGFRGWAEIWPAVERHWMPVVRGTAEAGAALRAIAEQVGGQQGWPAN